VKKLAFFLKTNAMIKFSHTLEVGILSKNTPTISQKNLAIFLIIALVPWIHL
jgi:hypothetical protein